MKKISNADYKEIESYNDSINEKTQQLKSLVDVINAKFMEILEQEETEDGHNLASLLDIIGDEKATIHELLSEQLGQVEGYYDDRSEKWQESDKGECYCEWKHQLEQATEEFNSDLFELIVHTDEIASGIIQLEVSEVERLELPPQSPQED